MLGWLIGWNLTLEYAIGAAAVGRAWSGYFSSMMTAFGVEFPGWLNSWDLGFTHASPLAALIIAVCTAIMLLGAKDSAMFNNVMTGAPPPSFRDVCVRVHACVCVCLCLCVSVCLCVSLCVVV